jgi:hypothetical protein
MMAKKRVRASIEGEEEKKVNGIVPVIIVLVLIGAVIFAMLSGGPPGEQGEAEGLLTQSKQAVEQLTKESFTFSGSLESSVQGEYVSLKFSGEGRIDSANKRVYFKLNFESPTGLEEDTITIESYTIDDIVYTNFFDLWTKYEGETLWGESHFSEKIVDFANSFDALVGNPETVNGKQTIRVAVNPSLEDVIEQIESLNPSLTDRIGFLDAQLLGRAVRSISMQVWIDQQSLLPVKSEFTLEIAGKDLSQTGGGVISSDLIASGEINFDYTTPFNIVLPTAAQDAVAY